MTLSSKTITNGFIIAGLMNMSVLVFSRFFTNKVINETDPDVMSNFGLLMIVVWGLAYISVAKNYTKLKWLVGVLAFEKLIYGFVWLRWILKNDIMAVYKKDTMAGVFFSIYGVNDLLFCIFFTLVFASLFKSQTDLKN